MVSAAPIPDAATFAGTLADERRCTAHGLAHVCRRHVLAVPLDVAAAAWPPRRACPARRWRSLPRRQLARLPFIQRHGGAVNRG